MLKECFFIFKFQFNIFALGNFLKTEFFNVHEHYTKLVFPAKIFLFEKCLLYTRVSSNDKKTLSYRDHYMFGVSFNMQLKVILTIFLNLKILMKYF